jgi:hypothetical protein
MAEPDDTTPLDVLTRGRRGRRPRLSGWPLALILVWVGLAATDIVIIAPFSAASSHSSAKASGHRGHQHAGGAGQSHRRHRHRTTSSPSPRPSATPRVLIPASATAFGPDGVSSGDNPSSAPAAVDASAATAWSSQWYATAEFGSLKTGTGLLIDMGKAVRVTSVRILLEAAGADLTVYTGAVPVLADERVQAAVKDASGDVHLALATPERARYLVIWFTLLPPDSAGTYRATVYDVQVKGTTGARSPG